MAIMVNWARALVAPQTALRRAAVASRASRVPDTVASSKAWALNALTVEMEEMARSMMDAAVAETERSDARRGAARA